MAHTVMEHGRDKKGGNGMMSVCEGSESCMNDLISRQAAIEAAEKGCLELKGVFEIIKGNLKALPSANEMCKVDVLDKIRGEIEQTAKDYDKFADYRRIYGLWIAIDIIDKYKAESEV